MKILHVIDDKKFIDFCKKTFDLNGIHNFYIKGRELTTDIIDHQKINVIFVHFLSDTVVNFFSHNRLTVPVVWMFWGGDGFSLPNFYNTFLDSHSEKALLKIKFRSGLVSLLKHLIKIGFKKSLNRVKSTRRKIDVINNFDYVVPIVPGDYDLLCKEYRINTPGFHFNYVTSPVGTVDDGIQTRNIILGNSASITNNHISIIEKLKNSDMSGRKIFVPLSYGNAEYKNYLTKYISDLNDDTVVPIVNFLEYEEYSRIINSCSVMIMNHQRQQALGNIVLGLANGCTVYLNAKSSLYSYLVSNGFIIKNVEDIEGLKEISYADKLKNFDLVSLIFGEERQKKLVSDLLSRFNR